MIGVRLPAAVVGRIDRMAAELGASADRSKIIRLLMEHVTGYRSYKMRGYGSYKYKMRVVGDLLVTALQSRRRGRTQADRIAFKAKEELKTLAAAYFAARKRPKVRRAKRTKAIEHTRAIEQK